MRALCRRRIQDYQLRSTAADHGDLKAPVSDVSEPVAQVDTIINVSELISAHIFER